MSVFGDTVRERERSEEVFAKKAHDRSDTMVTGNVKWRLPGAVPIFALAVSCLLMAMLMPLHGVNGLSSTGERGKLTASRVPSMGGKCTQMTSCDTGYRGELLFSGNCGRWMALDGKESCKVTLY